jgi:hypothetical protein
MARDAEPVVRPVESRPSRVETPQAAKAGAPSPVVPRRRTAPKNGADTTPYPVPRAPAFALPSEPALMTRREHRREAFVKSWRELLQRISDKSAAIADPNRQRKMG